VVTTENLDLPPLPLLEKQFILISIAAPPAIVSTSITVAAMKQSLEKLQPETNH